MADSGRPSCKMAVRDQVHDCQGRELAGEATAPHNFIIDFLDALVYCGVVKVLRIVQALHKSHHWTRACPFLRLDSRGQQFCEGPGGADEPVPAGIDGRMLKSRRRLLRRIS